MSQQLFAQLAKYGPISIVAGALLWFVLGELNTKLDRIIEIGAVSANNDIESRLILIAIKEGIESQNAFMLENITKETAMEHALSIP